MSDTYPIGAKRNVNKHDSALHVEREDGQSFFMEGVETPEEAREKKSESRERLVPNVQMFLQC